eukprot:CAMPEP_0196810356 /NCGR_PEP_ID=MMETSP1362-20130617/10169_1 /TAXON_ID=163516 /ORGANISM="Leptocylindrus danicus, Strain CCMP1856" /LENGTH=81 /DNA_ID=CAMNT_0042185299 /DNA_START=689 /DNA_END=931 /DNA_ORIENTATION=-
MAPDPINSALLDSGLDAMIATVAIVASRFGMKVNKLRLLVLSALVMIFLMPVLDFSLVAQILARFPFALTLLLLWWHEYAL